MLKLRSKQRMFSGLSRSFGTLQTGVRATSFLGSCVLGPQVSLAFSMAGLSHTQHTHGGPEPAHLQVEVCFASNTLFPPHMHAYLGHWAWLASSRPSTCSSAQSLPTCK